MIDGVAVVFVRALRERFASQADTEKTLRALEVVAPHHGERVLRELYVWRQGIPRVWLHSMVLPDCKGG